MSGLRPGDNPTEKISLPRARNGDRKEPNSTSTDDLVPDKVLSDLLKRDSEGEKYIVGKKIAQGGMGAIYEVFDQDLQRTSVLKVILPGALEDVLLFRRFVEEAQITGQLEHPNIIPVHELGVLGTRKLYFSMKYVQGEALGSVLKKVREGNREYIEKYSRFTLLTIFRKVCDAVAYAHSKKIIHRDIKPDNIMVGEFGEVLVMDWGLARPQDRHEENEEESNIFDENFSDYGMDTLKTRYGVVKGTPTYMSPEQAKGWVRDIDHRSDIFLLGATLYAMVTFEVPFTGNDVYEILANAENCDYIEPHLRAPERQIPEELCRIIVKSMACNKIDRYQKVEELTYDLDALMAGNTVSVRKHFQKGEYIIQEGEPGHEAYVVLRGKVEVTKSVSGKILSLVTLKEGDIIGEMALILQAPRSASVQAKEETEVVVINEDTMKQGLGHLPPWMGKVVDSLADRLRSANQNVHPLLNSDCTYPILNQLRIFYCFWSELTEDPISGEPIAKVNTSKMTQEIAINLGLPKERIILIITKLLESKLFKAFGSDSFYIPNFEIFCQFIRHVQTQLGLDSGFENGVMKTSLFSEKGDLVVCHFKERKKMILSFRKEVSAAGSEELPSLITGDEKERTFTNLMGELRDLFLPAEDSNRSGAQVL